MQRFKIANIITMSLVSIIPLLVTNNKKNTPNIHTFSMAVKCRCSGLSVYLFFLNIVKFFFSQIIVEIPLAGP